MCASTAATKVKKYLEETLTKGVTRLSRGILEHGHLHVPSSGATSQRTVAISVASRLVRGSWSWKSSFSWQSLLDIMSITDVHCPS